ncbi:unnamed protein product [Microthlaspi erraticum]|uniref:Uncharacterized protein n=1 Tax=Microthlaspi erraticum TaxID=1685480 RepID=A0A6D2HVI8_9BRAS|nr:unnamed protein product [Microthlaspi erraticum]
MDETISSDLMHNMSDEELLWRVSSAKFPPSSAFYLRHWEVWRMGKNDNVRCREEASCKRDKNDSFFLLDSCIPSYLRLHTYITKSKHIFMGSFDDRSPYGRGRYNGNMSLKIP